MNLFFFASFKKNKPLDYFFFSIATCVTFAIILSSYQVNEGTRTISNSASLDYTHTVTCGKIASEPVCLLRPDLLVPPLGVSIGSLSALAQFGPSELHPRPGHHLFNPLLLQNRVWLQGVQVHRGVEQSL